MTIYKLGNEHKMAILSLQRNNSTIQKQGRFYDTAIHDLYFDTTVLNPILHSLYVYDFIQNIPWSTECTKSILDCIRFIISTLKLLVYPQYPIFMYIQVSKMPCKIIYFSDERLNLLPIIQYFEIMWLCFISLLSRCSPRYFSIIFFLFFVYLDSPVRYVLSRSTIFQLLI